MKRFVLSLGLALLVGACETPNPGYQPRHPSSYDGSYRHHGHHGAYHYDKRRYYRGGGYRHGLGHHRGGHYGRSYTHFRHYGYRGSHRRRH